MSLHEEMISMGDRAVAASRRLALLSSRRKTAILRAMADELESQKDSVCEANRKDVETGRQAGLSAPMLDRLTLNDKRYAEMVQGIRDVAELKDPVGKLIKKMTRPNGLLIEKVRVPIGVIGIIFESRPNVTADTAALCLKTANAVILRGGKESINSNAAIAEALAAGGARKGLPVDSIQLIRTTDRDAIRELVQLEGRVDLVIPRGGEALIRAVTEQARIPVIKHYKGVCHTYVDESANTDMAMAIAVNAKCQRPATCNAMEKLLVHGKIADEFLPKMAAKFKELNVELRGDAASRAIVPWIREAADADWDAEYLDLVLTVGIVSSVQAAVDHINKHGSKHSDAIIAESREAQEVFLNGVDSATVYVNASTRFTDGGQFGMGAEIGISTDKLHARGPMALEELTTYKYLIRGNGQLRE